MPRGDLRIIVPLDRVESARRQMRRFQDSKPILFVLVKLFGMERIIYTPPGGPPQGPGPNAAIYGIMGESNIFKMIGDFYKELEMSEIRSLFPPNMEEASKKSAAFFVTILGGPPLYFEKYGPPRMRARHLPFEIDERSRQVWLACFDRILEGADMKYQFPQQYLEGFRDFLKSFFGLDGQQSLTRKGNRT